MSCSLSGDRLASRALESTRMPRYSRQVVGPSRLERGEGVEVVCTWLSQECQL